ncbi:unnamed protein product [Coccothraustes coccothraustes]
MGSVFLWLFEMNTPERPEHRSSNERIFSYEAEDCTEAARNLELRGPQGPYGAQRGHETGREVKKAERMREMGEAVQPSQGLQKPLPRSECKEKGGAPF